MFKRVDDEPEQEMVMKADTVTAGPCAYKREMCYKVPGTTNTMYCTIRRYLNLNILTVPVPIQYEGQNENSLSLSDAAV